MLKIRSSKLLLNLCRYLHPVDLYLISEKSIWNWIFTACVACKKTFELIFAIHIKIQFVELEFSNLIFQNSSTDQQGVRLSRDQKDLSSSTKLIWSDLENHVGNNLLARYLDHFSYLCQLKKGTRNNVFFQIVNLVKVKCFS